MGYGGEPFPGVEQRIARDGELQVKSPGMMLGYWVTSSKKTLQRMRLPGMDGYEQVIMASLTSLADLSSLGVERRCLRLRMECVSVSLLLQ